MMFGWSKREKNDKSQNKATVELKCLDAKAKGKKLSRLRKRYPNHLIVGGFDFMGVLFDYDLIILYLLLCDNTAMEEADLYDNPDPVEPLPIEITDPVEAAVVAEQGDSPDQSNFDSSTPVESLPAVESASETTSFDSGSDSDGYDSGGGDCGGGD